MRIESMVKPRSVAIIGASRDPEKVGHIILQNYLNAGYSGKLYPVNKEADSILGIKAYPDISKIKEKVDLAVIAIPAKLVPGVMEECGKAGVKSVIVVSGGFAEVGETELQNKLASIAIKYGMPTLGPNCLGVMDPRSRVDTLFLPTYKLSRPQIGGVSFMAQSGAVGSTVLDMISGEGFGLSKFFSYGNAAHVDEVDILRYLAEDNDTKVIVMYLEGIKRGKEFLKAARETTNKKPVIVLKAGRTSAGMAAAHSHTAALAGDYQVHEAAFRQSGMTVANDLSELLNYAKIFETEPAPRGGNVAIITNGGGMGVLTTDAIASSKRLKLASFSDKTKASLRKTMPSLVNIRNPLDLAGEADGKRYSDAMDAIKDDENIDMLIVITLFQTPGADSTVASSIIRIKESFGKPLIALCAGASYTQMHKIMMESAGVPVYDSPSAAAASLEATLKYSMFKKQMPDEL